MLGLVKKSPEMVTQSCRMVTAGAKPMVGSWPDPAMGHEPREEAERGGRERR
jgi:hypothetical protein